MAIKVQGTDVIDDSRSLRNITSIDSTTENTLSTTLDNTLISQVNAGTGLSGGGSSGSVTLNGVTQPTSDWEAGTSTTESLVSPAKVKAAIDSLVTSEPSIGVGQTWQNVTGSRNVGTTYTNNTGKPILVGIKLGGAGTEHRIFVDSVNIKNTNVNNAITRTGDMTFIVPSGSNYGAVAISGFPRILYWAELR